MELVIEEYSRDRIPAVLEFERRLREEEDFWGWEIDENYGNTAQIGGASGDAFSAICCLQIP